MCYKDPHNWQLGPFITAIYATIICFLAVQTENPGRYLKYERVSHKD